MAPHVCIGNRVAMIEAQLILATLVQHVTFDLVPGQQIVPDVLRRKGGGKVMVRRR